MAHNKDTSFKHIGKNHRKVLFELTDLPEDLVVEDFEDVTEELGTLKTVNLRPDLILQSSKAIVMYEFESSYVEILRKKRFLVYVTLYDYLINEDEEVDIYFTVISTIQKTGVITHKIDDIIEFKINVININDLNFEQIINMSNSKIEYDETFSPEEVVKLALTSIMPKKRTQVKSQFHTLSDMGKIIKFGDENSRTSFYGLLMLLSSIYFEKNDPYRDELKRDLMNKVDMVREIEEEGIEKGKLEVGINFLKKGYPIEEVSEMSEIPIEDLKREYEKVKNE